MTEHARESAIEQRLERIESNVFQIKVLVAVLLVVVLAGFRFLSLPETAGLLWTVLWALALTGVGVYLVCLFFAVIVRLTVKASSEDELQRKILREFNAERKPSDDAPSSR